MEKRNVEEKLGLPPSLPWTTHGTTRHMSKPAQKNMGALGTEPPKLPHLGKWPSSWGSLDTQQEQGHYLLPSERPHGAGAEEGKGLLCRGAAMPGIPQSSAQLISATPPARPCHPFTDGETEVKEPPRGHSATSAPHPRSRPKCAFSTGSCVPDGLNTHRESQSWHRKARVPGLLGEDRLLYLEAGTARWGRLPEGRGWTVQETSMLRTGQLAGDPGKAGWFGTQDGRLIKRRHAALVESAGVPRGHLSLRLQRHFVRKITD